MATFSSRENRELARFRENTRDLTPKWVQQFAVTTLGNMACFRPWYISKGSDPAQLDHAKRVLDRIADFGQVA